MWFPECYFISIVALFNWKVFPKVGDHFLFINYEWILSTLYRFLLLKIMKKTIASSTRMIHVPYIGSWSLNCVKIKVLVQFCQFVLYLTWVKHRNLIHKLVILCVFRKRPYSVFEFENKISLSQRIYSQVFFQM